MARSLVTETMDPTRPSEGFLKDGPDANSVENNFLDWVHLFVRYRLLILRCVLYCTLGSVLLAFSMPVYYSGETGILPPQQSQSIANSMMGQLAPLMALSGKDIGLKNPSDTYVALLQSRSVADAIIEK